jgi:hypothetical protein
MKLLPVTTHPPHPFLSFSLIHGIIFSCCLLVVNQFYQSRVIDEFVLQGNSATMKCSIPSFVADFVYVDSWFSDQEEEFGMNSDNYGIRDLLLSSPIIPGFHCTILKSMGKGLSLVSFSQISVVNQYYEPQVYDAFVIKGNPAIFKCQIPSFVSDHVEIVEWVDTDNGSYTMVETNLGTYLSDLTKDCPYPSEVFLQKKTRN